MLIHSRGTVLFKIKNETQIAPSTTKLANTPTKLLSTRNSSQNWATSSWWPFVFQTTSSPAVQTSRLDVVHNVVDRVQFELESSVVLW